MSRLVNITDYSKVVSAFLQLIDLKIEHKLPSGDTPAAPVAAHYSATALSV